MFGSYMLATYLRFGTPPHPNLAAVLTALPALSAAAVIGFAALRLYSLDQRDCRAVVSNAALGAVFTSILAAALAFWLRVFPFPRGVLLIAFPIHLLLAVLWHRAVFSTARRLRRPRRILVACFDAETIPVLRKVWDAATSGFHVVAACPADDAAALSIGGLGQIDAVLIGPNCSRDVHGAVIRVAQAAGKEVYLVPGLEELYLSGAEAYRVDDLPLLRLRPLGLTKWQVLVKRVIDLALGSLALTLLALPMLVVASAIIASSRGQALFRQTRVGRGGRPFVLFKFRTMVRNAEQGSGPVLCSPSDPRVTTLGRCLRTLRVDEWPQLFNVLRGDMSLVGPRPERPEFVTQFQASVPDYHLRHLVSPGITGLAQLAAHYGSSPSDKLRHDLSYIRKWSPLLDLHIIFQTLGLFATGGAEHVVAQDEPLAGDLKLFVRASGMLDSGGLGACAQERAESENRRRWRGDRDEGRYSGRRQGGTAAADDEDGGKVPSDVG